MTYSQHTATVNEIKTTQQKSNKFFILLDKKRHGPGRTIFFFCKCELDFLIRR